MTLPDRTLELLTSVDADRARAIAKAADWATSSGGAVDKSPLVELVEIDSGRSIIVVGPSRYLAKISWLRRVEIAPARYLLVIPSGTAIETLEVALLDLLDNLPAKGHERERTLLTELRLCITRQRRSDTISKAELLLIDTSG